MLLCASLSALATTLTPEQALNRVKGESVRVRSLASKVINQPQLLTTINANDGVPAVYLFGNANGSDRIVVSADDVAQPLLGYLDEDYDGTDEILPPEFEWWLNQYAAEIATARSSSTAVVNRGGRGLDSSTERVAIAPMLTTKWNQDAPFNDLCPKATGSAYSNGNSPTGCVATAMAQVMNYFEWPKELPNDTVTATNATKGKVSLILSTITFDWDNMLDSYSDYTDAQGTAVAQLMQACGYSVAMSYGVSASGAQTRNVATALVDHYNYDGRITYEKREYYNRDEWESLIYNNLSEVGPVIYAGYTGTSGHCFVCDGYSADNYFHFNWGWGGMSDGYFLLSALNPSSQGIGGATGGYNLDQEVVLGIRPSTGEDVTHSIGLLCSESASISDYVGSEPSSTDDLYLAVNGRWSNQTLWSETIILGLKLEPVDENGASTAETKYITLYSTTLNPSYGYSTIRLRKSYLTTNGTYKVSVIYKASEEDEWIDCHVANGVVGYAYVTKEGDTFTFSAPAEAGMPEVTLEFTTPLYYNVAAKANITIANNNESEYLGAVQPVLIDADNNVVAQADNVFVDLMPGESFSNETVFTFTYSDTFATNTEYILEVIDQATSKVLGTFGTVTVTEVEAGTITCTSFTYDDALSTDKDNLHFTAEIKCTSGYFVDQVYLGVFEKIDGNFSLVLYQAFPDLLILNANESATVTISASIPSAEQDVTYYAAPYYNSKQMDGILVKFTIPVVTGVESVAADNSLAVTFDRLTATAHVSSAATVTNVEVFGIDGRMLPATITYNGTEANIDLSNVASGIAVIRATDASGAVRTQKLAR